MSILALLAYIGATGSAVGGIICLIDAVRYSYRPLIIQAVGLLLFSAALIMGQLRPSDGPILAFAVPSIICLAWFQRKYASAWASHKNEMDQHQK